MAYTESYAPPRLPQELTDHIIDHLYDDSASLRSCALVCHSWLPPSRYHLFAKVSLKATSAQAEPSYLVERCKRLHRTLVESPEIICNIRELEICEGSPLHHPHPDVQGSTTWVTTERSLTGLFKILTHVRRFDFSATSALYWTLLPPTFQKALCTLLSSPSLTYVRIHSWVFPNSAALSSLLSHCKNLKAFGISSTAVLTDNHTDSQLPPDQVNTNNDATISVTEHQEISLDVLTLDFVTFSYLEYWLLSNNSLVNIRSLRELRVANFYDASVVDKLLQAVGGSLEHFHLKPGIWDVYPFNLSRNSGLRSIRLTLDNPEKALPWAIALLSTMSATTNPYLESVGLEFYSDPKKIDGWSELDALFIQPELSGLKQVEIGLFAIPTHADFKRVQDEMDGVVAREIVRWYRLGIKSQKSSRQLTPRISRYEAF
ncbi:hypothetical protein CPB83DRAFT_857133 [Crepidotus variabilis]|uniref:F-box domain-containing protein n=1 Tax=Crepidotus variabilis TaxID=179855 RepID=A0A9P6ED96_9AGAR|nr:hypothetical protein CPB83DRAFT_857133 [Crepidotus variabilis]